MSTDDQGFPPESALPLIDSLTVMRNFLDGDLSEARIARLVPEERRELRALITESYGEWIAPPPGKNEFRAFVATNPARLAPGHAGGSDTAALAAALLYAERVAIPDPLERRIEPTVEQIRSVAAVAPLVDAELVSLFEGSLRRRKGGDDPCSLARKPGCVPLMAGTHHRQLRQGALLLANEKPKGQFIP